jgi:hypothetical protein
VRAPVKFSLLLIAAACSALAGAVYLVLQVERGAVDRAVLQYVFALMAGVLVPALLVTLWRTATPWRGFAVCAGVYSATAAAVAATLAFLLLRL